MVSQLYPLVVCYFYFHLSSIFVDFYSLKGSFKYSIISFIFSLEVFFPLWNFFCDHSITVFPIVCHYYNTNFFIIYRHRLGDWMAITGPSIQIENLIIWFNHLNLKINVVNINIKDLHYSSETSLLLNSCSKFLSNFICITCRTKSVKQKLRILIGKLTYWYPCFSYWQRLSLFGIFVFWCC